MRVIPAIDLHEGQCVRLYKGDFDRVTVYSNDPLSIARGYEAQAFEDLHIVDLDGARTGAQQNAAIVQRMCAEIDLTVQLGGGIRSEDDVRRWLDNGVERCVIGSLALSEPGIVTGMLTEYGNDRIVVALDVSIENSTPVVATHGWAKSSGLSLWDCLDRYVGCGLLHVLCTDISRDGAMAGPNTLLYSEVMRRYPLLQLQASGGVRGIADLEALADGGIPAAITGKALLDGKIVAAEVASFLQSA